MAGPSIGTWVKVKNKSGRMTSRVIPNKLGGGGYEQGQVITQSEFQKIQEQRAKAKSKKSPQVLKSRYELNGLDERSLIQDLQKSDGRKDAKGYKTTVYERVFEANPGGTSPYKAVRSRVSGTGYGQNYVVVKDRQGGYSILDRDTGTQYKNVRTKKQASALAVQLLSTVGDNSLTQWSLERERAIKSVLSQSTR